MHTRGALSMRHELARKAIHVSSVAVPLAYAAGVPQRIAAAALLGLALFALIVERVRLRSLSAGAWFARIFGPLLREHEQDRWAGATWLLLAFFLAVALLPRDVAIAAMWAVAVGDATAAIVGRAFGHGGSRGAPGASAGRKTYAGTAACWVATLIGALFVAQVGVAASVVAATAAAAAERPRVPIDDNLRIVVAVAIGILLWRFAFA